MKYIIYVLFYFPTIIVKDIIPFSAETQGNEKMNLQGFAADAHLASLQCTL